MLSKKEIYRQAIKELENERLILKQQQDRNREIIFAACPEIENLEKKIKLKLSKLMKFVFNNKSNDNNILTVISKMKNEIMVMQEKIKILLRKNNIPENFLEFKPYCAICNDSGIVGQQRCECFKKIVRKITIKELQNSSCCKLTSFKNFNLNFYSKNEITEENVSYYNQMEAIFNICKNFATSFPNVDGYGLFMHGSTGLGKTHLSMAIASTLITKNFNVLYMTTPELIIRYSDYYFRRNQSSELSFESSILDSISNSDLLIIDDLGAELESKFTIAAIFEILNTRISKQKPVILNSNLDPEEIKERYGVRVFSRISAHLQTLNFVGTDNRQKLNRYNS